MSVIEAPAPATTVGDVIERIADVLEEFGWCQGAAVLPYGIDVTDPCVEAFCVGGAAVRATIDLGCRSSIATEALQRISPTSDLFAWNDAPGRTKAEVVARVREAAERAREEEA